MSLTAFEERRLLGWGDFLLEIEEQYPIDKLKKDEKKYYNSMVKSGDEIQEQLNENWLVNGFMPYKSYAKQMNYFINLQNEIIENIKYFLKEL